MELEKGGRTVREILFRGIATEDVCNDGCGISKGDFVFGQLVRNENETYIVGELIEATDEYIAPDFWIPVDPETVGEFTGLPDINGVPAYEGDIIKTHYANAGKSELIEKIIFHNGRFVAEYSIANGKSWAPLADGIKHVSCDKSVYMTDFEIMGNVPENPELLEVKP